MTTRNVLDQASTDDANQQQAAGERNLLAAIIDSSDDIIASKTLEGVITSWNRGAELVLGYRADEVVGKHVSMLMPPEASEDTKLILDRIRRGEKVDHYETRRRRKDGTVIDVSLTVSPIRDAAGNIIGASKVGRDITETRRAQSAVSEANRRKDEFLAMLAHELKNPLSAISNAVKLARTAELNETLRWCTEVTERQVKQLSRLIDDLLDVSRINQGKIQLRKEVVDIGPIINCAVDVVRPLIEERKHKLSVSFGPGTLRVNADPVRLEQIVVNLLTNAAKYTGTGGRLWLTAEHDESDVVLRFRDTGVGIPPEKLPAMFQLFVQGDESITRSEGGLGIGLTLVKNLVELHEGSVSASSEGVGKGSEFTVRLPGAAEFRIEQAQAHATSDSGKRCSRILVVDDNADSATGLARLLKLLGHDVRVAHDGPAAIADAATFLPEVVLLDIGLPNMDGYEVARHLRATSNCKNAVIVAVSGYGQDDDRRRTREAGFNFHLVKPINADALLSILDTA
jgi:PAS domain S-box-containing protein